MACPQGQKLLIRSVADVIKVANDPRGGAMRIFLTNSVTDALAIVQGAPGHVQVVNIANVGRFDRSDEAQKIALVTNVILNPTEVEVTKQLCATGVPVIHQVGVTDTKVDIASLIEKR